MPRSWKIRAHDILKAISEIELFTDHETFEEFSTDTKAVRATTACFTVIGEVVTHIPGSIKSQHPEIPWEQVKGMRNRIAHEYFNIDEQVLWRTSKERLPELKKQIENLLLENETS